MPTKVLVFESDPAFAGELRTELGRLGLAAQIVDDGNAGLMAAAAERPDLILLSIELPRMSGFSVCNKLKRDPVLKDVPLIIMSSESSDDTFEQHRKLRWRAEDYVHKPIAFGELLEHIRPYVPLDNGGRGSVDDDSGIVIEDDIQVEDPDEFEATEQGPKRRNSVAIAAEVDAFADSAFDHLMEGGASFGGASIEANPAAPPSPERSAPVSDISDLLASSIDPARIDATTGSDEPVVALDGGPLAQTAIDELPASSPVDIDTGALTLGHASEANGLSALEPESEDGRESVADVLASLEAIPEDEVAAPSADPPSAVRKSSAPPRPTIDAEVSRLRGELERQKVETSRLERDLADTRGEVRRLEALALQEGDHSNEQVARLQRELEDLRQKAPAGAKVGGVSSREFLDLREALNKKDKEILGLRDLISRKEKELLDASDSALSLERDKADLDDKIASLEKEMQAARFLSETAKADKEQAAKRAEDFKARGEKTKAELELKQAELAGIQQKHDSEIAQRDAAIAALREEHQQQLAREVAARESAITAEQQAAQEKLEGQVREARESEQRARYDAVSKLKEEWEGERRSHEEALAKLRSELETDKAIALAALEGDLRQQWDGRAAEAMRVAEEEQNRLKQDVARAWDEARGAAERVSARERELEEQLQAALLAQKGELEGRFAAERTELESRFANERTELEARSLGERAELEARFVTERAGLFSERSEERALLESRVNELATDLAARTEERETFSREVAQQREKIATLEATFAETKLELTVARERLSTQSERLDAVTSKWQLNRTSLEQAKDAIAAAVAQIEEAETRGLE